MPSKRSPPAEHAPDTAKRQRAENAVASSSRVTLDGAERRRAAAASGSDSDDDDDDDADGAPAMAMPRRSRRVLPRLDPDWTYELVIVQQPDRARACGFGNKDRRPVSPPTIAQLIVRAGKEIVSADIVPSHFLMLSATLFGEHYEERGIVLQAGQKAPDVLPSPMFDSGFPPAYEASTRPTTASSYRPTTNGSPAIGPDYDRAPYALAVPPSPTMYGHYRHSSPQHGQLPSIDEVTGLRPARPSSGDKAYGTPRIPPPRGAPERASPEAAPRPDSAWSQRSDDRRLPAPVHAAHAFEGARFDPYRQPRPSTSHDRREGYHVQLEPRPSTSYADFRFPAAARTPPTPPAPRSLYTGWAPESPYSSSPLPPRPEHGPHGPHGPHGLAGTGAGAPYGVDPWELNVIRSAQLYTHTLVGQHHALGTCLLDMDNRPGIFFFPHDIAVRSTGLFRLRLQVAALQDLMELQDRSKPGRVLAEAYTDVFETFSAKTFKNVMPVTQLTAHFTNQGVRLPGRAERKDDGDD